MYIGVRACERESWKLDPEDGWVLVIGKVLGACLLVGIGEWLQFMLTKTMMVLLKNYNGF